MQRLSHLFFGIVVFLASTPAWSQTSEGAKDLPMERFQLSLDRNGILGVEWAEVPDHLNFDLSLMLNFSDDVLVLRDPTTDDKVGELIGSRLTGNIVGAIALLDWIQIGIDIPVMLYQDRGDNFVVNQANGTVLDGLNQFGVGSIRLAPKLRLLTQDAQGIGLAILANVILPSAKTDSYLGRDTLVVSPELLVSRNFANAIRVAINVGYRVNEISNLAALASANGAIALSAEDELFARAGVGVIFDRVEVDLTLSMATSAKDPFGLDNQNHLETIGGVTYNAANDLQLFAAAGLGLQPGYGTPQYRAIGGVRVSHHDNDKDGDGIPDKNDKCIDDPEDKDDFEDSDGCPDNDNDQDGVFDFDDGAPNDPEDKDGFEDEDGVPDPDNDKDGILDTNDKCPLEAGTKENEGCPYKDTDGDGIHDGADQCVNQPEDKDGFEDEDGCPEADNDKDGVVDAADGCPLKPGPVENKGCPDTDRDGDTVVDRLDNCPDEPGEPKYQGCKKKQLVVITKERLEIKDRVYFAVGRSAIRKRSHLLLKNVAAVVKAHPELRRIRIEGHTDSRGSEALNKRLSQDRAKSVLKFLVAEGVEEERMIAVGFGEEKPVESNRTRAGRAANRRVDFVILDKITKIETKDAPEAE